MFALDGKPPSEAEQAAYLAAVARIRQQSIPVQGVLLYGLARPSMQPQAGRLSALPAEWLECLRRKNPRGRLAGEGIAMIHGIGTDLLDAGRIRSGLARFGEPYAEPHPRPGRTRGL